MAKDKEPTDEVLIDDVSVQPIPEAKRGSEGKGEPAREEPEERAEDNGRTSRMMRMARKLMDRKELTQDTRDLLVNVLATSDKAKTEAVRMVAREVRNYLEALELKEDMLRIMTSYSLEVSVRLKPLADAIEEEEKSNEPG